MKFSFLPEEIKSQIDRNLIEHEALALARSNMAMDGHMGESFIVAYAEILYFFTKAMGSSQYTKIESSYSDIDEMTVTSDSKHSIISVKIGRKKYTFKFAPLILKDLEKVLEKWLSGSISPFIALLSALMYLAAADNNVTDEEHAYITKLANEDETLLNIAHDFYHKIHIETLLDMMSQYDEDQKFCIMANMLELAMCDGVIHSNELKLLRQFAKHMNISDEEYETVKQILLIKNQIGILKRKPQ